MALSSSFLVVLCLFFIVIVGSAAEAEMPLKSDFDAEFDMDGGRSSDSAGGDYENNRKPSKSDKPKDSTASNTTKKAAPIKPANNPHFIDGRHNPDYVDSPVDVDEHNQQFAEIDTNNNGRIEKEELMQSSYSYAVNRLFKSQNQRTITKSEFMAIFTPEFGAFPAANIPVSSGGASARNKTSDEELRDHAQTFDSVDENRDGVVDMDEMIDGHVVGLFSLMDKNGDKVISRKEYMDEFLMNRSADSYAMNFHDMDDDSDGYISVQEFEAEEKHFDNEPFGSIDVNADGKISMDEYVIFRRRDAHFLKDGTHNPKYKDDKFEQAFNTRHMKDFDVFDTNKDSFISVDDAEEEAVAEKTEIMIEIEKKFPHVATTKKDRVKKMIRNMDDNKDGKISFDEYCHHHSFHNSKHQEKLTTGFKAIDRNGDGNLTMLEYVQSGMSLVYFLLKDINGDLNITKEEFLKSKEVLHQHQYMPSEILPPGMSVNKDGDFVTPHGNVVKKKKVEGGKSAFMEKVEDMEFHEHRVSHEIVDKFHEIFSSIDKNRNNLIEFSELYPDVRNVPIFPIVVTKDSPIEYSVMKRIDIDQNGSLTNYEWLILLDRKWAAFEMIDTSKDNLIQSYELYAYKDKNHREMMKLPTADKSSGQLSESAVVSLFKSMDVDDSKTLTIEEFRLDSIMDQPHASNPIMPHLDPICGRQDGSILKLDAEFRRIFDEADTDNDGRIMKTEYDKLAKALKIELPFDWQPNTTELSPRQVFLMACHFDNRLFPEYLKAKNKRETDAMQQFAQLDVDFNGSLTMRESGADFNFFKEFLDRNNDSIISREEFLAIADDLKLTDKALQIFYGINTNRDLYISKLEFDSYFHSSEEKKNTDFSVFDKNGDGYITFEEEIAPRSVEFIRRYHSSGHDLLPQHELLKNIEDHRQEFGILDKNTDGYLSAEEVFASGIDPKLLDGSDRNVDGKIDLLEFLEVLEPKYVYFLEMDKDHNMKVTHREFFEAVKGLHSRPATLFSLLDLDNNGYLTVDECPLRPPNSSDNKDGSVVTNDKTSKKIIKRKLPHETLKSEKQIMNLFSAMDTDKDGYLSLNEVRQANPSLIRSWNRLNPERDPKGISELEFLSQFDESHILDNYQHEFMLMDKDKNNVIGPSEWTGKSIYQPEKEFEVLDADKSGVLTYSEIYGSDQPRSHYGQDGHVETSDDIARHKVEFRHLDSNDDGILDSGDMDSDTWSQLASRADHDQDEAVSLNEYLASFTRSKSIEKLRKSRDTATKQSDSYLKDFETLDITKDGFLDRLEIVSWPDTAIVAIVHSKKGRISKFEWMKHYDKRYRDLLKADKNKDNQLSPTEFSTLYPDEPFPFQIFNLLDDNSDGVLTYSELPDDLNDMFKGTSARERKLTLVELQSIKDMEFHNGVKYFKEDFDTIDLNEDGYIDAKEMKAARIDEDLGFEGDTDLNNMLDKGEFIHMFSNSRRPSEKSAKRKLPSQMTFKEFRNANNGMTAGDARLQFNALDLNHDNILTGSEVDAALENTEQSQK